MRRRMLSFLAIPMLFLGQCAPDGCAPPGNLRPGTIISVGRIQTFGFGGHAGADYLNAAGNKICPDAVCNYWALRSFNQQGDVAGGGFPVQPSGVRMARLEFYPDLVYGNYGTNDVWNPNLTVGGLHLWNPDGRAVNGLQLPHASNGAVRYYATVTDGGAAVSNGRLEVYVFGLVNKDTTPGAFNIGSNRGSQWTAGWVWPGTYVMQFFDRIEGRSINVTADLRPSAPITIDLDQRCFGFATCTVTS